MSLQTELPSVDIKLTLLPDFLVGLLVLLVSYRGHDTLLHCP